MIIYLTLQIIAVKVKHQENIIIFVVVPVISSYVFMILI